MDTSSPENRHVTIVNGVTHRMSGAGTACGARIGIIHITGDVDCMACIADDYTDTTPKVMGRAIADAFMTNLTAIYS